MLLTGKQLQEICSALIDAYQSVDELRILVRFELDENLASIASGADLRIVVFNLVTWAERTGRINDLIGGAYRQIPGNAQLQALLRSVDAVANRSPSKTHSDRRTTTAMLAEPLAIDVFLSYSRMDVDAMRIVRDCLHEAGISVWTYEGLTPGTIGWRTSIEEAVAQAAAMVVLLSPDAKKSEWVDNEVGYAQTLSKPVFPVLTAGDIPTSVPINLVRVQLIDGREALQSTIIQTLVPVVLGSLGRVKVAAATTQIKATAPRKKKAPRPGTGLLAHRFRLGQYPFRQVLDGKRHEYV